MLRRALTYFLLALIVLQSAVAMGDAHQLHQSGAKHIVFDETHLHADGKLLETQRDQNVDSTASASDSWDCHHCCHCHGHLCPAILLTTERIQLAKNSASVLDYAESKFPETYEAFLRPPKA